MTGVTCDVCGIDLEDLADTSQPASCPKCGSIQRKIQITLSDVVAVTARDTLQGKVRDPSRP